MKTTQEIGLMAQEYASEYYDENSERTSVMYESIQHSNRATNFIAGYTACAKNMEREYELFNQWAYDNSWVYDGRWQLWRFELPGGMIDVTKDISHSGLLKHFRSQQSTEKGGEKKCCGRCLEGSDECGPDNYI